LLGIGFYVSGLGTKAKSDAVHADNGAVR
jgi:hypothetical protein